MEAEKLEEALKTFAQVASAGEDDAQRLVHRALRRLKADPTLLSGDPASVYTYEDPVLALAAEFAKLSESGAVSAAGDGREVRNSSLHRWLLVAARAVVSYSKRAEGV